MWDPKNDYKLIETLTGHSYNVQCLIELENGSIASAGSGDNTIKIRDPNNDHELI